MGNFWTNRVWEHTGDQTDLNEILPAWQHIERDIYQWKKTFDEVLRAKKFNPSNIKQMMVHTEKLMHENNRALKDETCPHTDVLEDHGIQEINDFWPKLENLMERWFEVLEDIKRGGQHQNLWDWMLETEIVMRTSASKIKLRPKSEPVKNKKECQGETEPRSKKLKRDQASYSSADSLEDDYDVCDTPLKNMTSQTTSGSEFLRMQSELHQYAEKVKVMTSVEEKNKLKLRQMENEVSSAQQRIKYLEDAKVKHEEEIQHLEGERQGLLTRLSKLAGDKLTDNNPNITDLSDQHRPTKLGEVYSELYDNEWTDAFSELTDSGYTDREAIDTLEKTLRHTFEFCEWQMANMVRGVSDVIHLENKKLDQPPSGRACQLPSRWKIKTGVKGDPTPRKRKFQAERVNVETQTRKFIKDISGTMVSVIQDSYIAQYWDNDCVPGMKPYLRKCVFLSWMMLTHSPALCLFKNPKPGERFDTSMYKSYLTSGNSVSYVVWPPMLLHRDGPLLAKGVAEAHRS